MTTITKPVRRKTLAARYSRGKNRAVCVTIHATRLEFRLHGERRAFSLSIADAMALAIRAHALAERDRKKAEKKARQKAKGV